MMTDHRKLKPCPCAVIEGSSRMHKAISTCPNRRTPADGEGDYPFPDPNCELPVSSRANDGGKWTTEAEIFDWLKGKNYSDHIAKELSKKISELYNGAFKKGKEIGSRPTPPRTDEGEKERKTQDYANALGFREGVMQERKHWQKEVDERGRQIAKLQEKLAEKEVLIKSFEGAQVTAGKIIADKTKQVEQHLTTISELNHEVGELKGENEGYANTLDSLDEHMTEQEAKLTRANAVIEAMRVYADPNNWQDICGCGDGLTNEVLHVGEGENFHIRKSWDIAKAALQAHDDLVDLDKVKEPTTT